MHKTPLEENTETGRLEQEHHQRCYPNGQQMQKLEDPSVTMGIQRQATVKYLHTPMRMGKIKTLDSSSYQQWCGETGMTVWESCVSSSKKGQSCVGNSTPVLVLIRSEHHGPCLQDRHENSCKNSKLSAGSGPTHKEAEIQDLSA